MYTHTHILHKTVAQVGVRAEGRANEHGLHELVKLVMRRRNICYVYCFQERVDLEWRKASQIRDS